MGRREIERLRFAIVQELASVTDLDRLLSVAGLLDIDGPKFAAHADAFRASRAGREATARDLAELTIQRATGDMESVVGAAADVLAGQWLRGDGERGV